MRKTIIVFLAALAVALIFSAPASAASTYVVQPGDSLFFIAQRYQVSVNDLQSVNSLHTSAIYPGQALSIPAVAQSATAKNTYLVQSGDSLFFIAQKFGISVEQLKRANDLSSTTLYPGQRLAISTAQASTPALASRGGFSWRDVDLLARIVNGEARGESYMGQVAVAAVILNRVKNPNFPKTIAGVIYQPYAFTAVSDGQINAALTTTAQKAAKAALDGWDPSQGAIYYWNPATATNKWVWSRQITVKIGNHVFAK